MEWSGFDRVEPGRWIGVKKPLFKSAERVEE